MTEALATGATGRSFSRWQRAAWCVLLPVMAGELVGIGCFAYRACSVPTVRLLRVLGGHTGPVLAIAFATDSRTLVAVGADNRGKAWNVLTGREQGTILDRKEVARIGEGRVVCEGGDLSSSGQTVFSLDGKTVAAAGPRSASVRVHDVGTDKLRSSFVGDPMYVTALAFSPDGRTLVSGGRGGSLRVWNPNTGKEQGRFVGHRSGVTCVVYLPNGESLLSGSWDRTVRLWDAATRSNRASITVNGGVEWLAVSPDGQTFAVQSYQAGELRDVTTGKVRAKFPPDLFASAALFSPDGRTLATICNNRLDATYEVKLWSVPP